MSINVRFCKKLTKRALAQAFRDAANNIEKYDWVQGEMGAKQLGFCTMGAIGNLLNVDQSADGGIHEHPNFKEKCAPDGLLNKLNVGTINSWPAVSRIIDFNDTRNPSTGKKEVQSVFRKIAAGLEHGGVL